MKLQPDRIDGANAIHSCTADVVSVNNQTALEHWRSSVIVPFKGAVQAWAPARFEDLQQAHFDALLAWQPELILFGSGTRIRFASPALTRGLINARIGFECMDNGAACRTYNVLVSEGRRAVLALLIG